MRVAVQAGAPRGPPRLRCASPLGLQVAETPCRPPRSTTPITSHASDEHRSGRLLLAEDNLINQKVAVAMLSSAGYQVDTVLNGAAAVRAVAAQPYDAILMDCQMPELNGYEATAAIRAQEGADRHTPIIAMTAGARREDRERCLAEGMDSYLAKPVSKDALLALVARSCARRALPRSSPVSRVGHTSADEFTIDHADLRRAARPRLRQPSMTSSPSSSISSSTTRTCCSSSSATRHRVGDDARPSAASRTASRAAARSSAVVGSPLSCGRLETTASAGDLSR